MIRDVNVNDLALIELNKHGVTEAPEPILKQLERAGFLTLHGGPKLTASGQTRATALAPCEGNLRAMGISANADRCSITTAGGASLRM
jgi:hypothetical protein